MIWVFAFAQSTVPLVNALRFLRGRVGWNTTSLILDDIPDFLLKNICYLFQNLWIWKWSTFDDWMESHDCSESHLVSHSSFCCHQLRLHFIITIIIVIIIVRLLTRVSTTNYYWLGNLSNRHLFSHISGGWTSKIKVAITGLASSGSCLPCL